MLGLEVRILQQYGMINKHVYLLLLPHAFCFLSDVLYMSDPYQLVGSCKITWKTTNYYFQPSVHFGH